MAEQILATVNATLTDKGLMLREGKREETQGITAQWHVAMRPGKRRALDKNTANLVTLFALSNLWMARRSLLQGVRG